MVDISFHNTFVAAIKAEFMMMNQPAPHKYSTNYKLHEYQELQRRTLHASTQLKEKIENMIEKGTTENDDHLQNTLESIQKTYTAITELSTIIEEYQCDIHRRLAILEDHAHNQRIAPVIILWGITLIYIFFYFIQKYVPFLQV
jgi:hypothetical protein